MLLQVYKGNIDFTELAEVVECGNSSCTNVHAVVDGESIMSFHNI